MIRDFFVSLLSHSPFVTIVFWMAAVGGAIVFLWRAHGRAIDRQFGPGWMKGKYYLAWGDIISMSLMDAVGFVLGTVLIFVVTAYLLAVVSQVFFL